jgi:cytochrome P450
MAHQEISQQAPGAAYDPFDQQFLDDPHPVYAKLHREAPVAWSDIFESWVVTRYDDVVRAVNDPSFSSHGKSGPMPAAEVLEELAAGYPMTEMLYGTDPPVHTRLRTLIHNALSNRLVEAFEPSFRATANDVVDTFAAAGSADLYKQYVKPLTTTAILDFVGVPRADHEQARTWQRTWEKLFIPGREPEDLRRETRKVVAYQHYLAALAADRATHPRDDLVSALVHVRADGHEPLATGEIVWGLIEIVGAAGNTNYGMANVIFRLLHDPDRWAALVRARDGLGTAVEEGMRVESPVLGCARETACPVELGGVQLPEGAPVLIAFAAANHDEAAFAKPDRFDLERPNASRQVTLGRGPHYCVGARLARMMITDAADVLLERLPTLRFEAGWEPEFYAPFPFLRSVAALPVRWDPSAAATG